MERKDLKPLSEIARLNSDKELLLCKYHEIADENLRLKQELIDIRKGKGRSYKIFATDCLKILLPVLFLFMSFIFKRLEGLFKTLSPYAVEIIIISALLLLVSIITFLVFIVIKSIKRE